MGIPNVSLRGSTYWWRRQIAVAGHTFPLALSLRTGTFHEARARAFSLSAESEKIRMAYGERGILIEPAILKRICSDALRLQLERILTDQARSAAPASAHEKVNRVYGEMWKIFASADPRYTADIDERLAKEGWPPEDRKALSRLWEESRHGPLVSHRQLEEYQTYFKYEPTTSNTERVLQTIYDARGAACVEANNRLVSGAGVNNEWIAAALASDEPLIHELARPTTRSETDLRMDPVSRPEPGAPSPMPAHSPPTAASLPDPQPAEVPLALPKKPLKEAAEDCISAHTKAGAWVLGSADQVRTAIRLFDFACGGEMNIDDLTQGHVDAFLNQFRRLPTRWGKTKQELAGGLPESLKYAAQLIESGNAQSVGVSIKTIGKHISWINAVIAHADAGAFGHRPALALNFKTINQKIIAKGENKAVRKRDLRSNWTPKEISRLLDAPIWHGCRDLDHRFDAGKQIFHDGAYYLPLMYIIYGGRSAELAALPIAHIFENAQIPYFKIAHSDNRSLKNAQSIRLLPIHPELIRLGFLDFIKVMRKLDHKLLFPEMDSPNSKSFASTFYKSVFSKWRTWAFPDGTEWRRSTGVQTKDKDVHSFRGVASNMMKGKVPDSVRSDILGHEGDNTTQETYDDEAELGVKLSAMLLVSGLTSQLQPSPLRLRPPERQCFGAGSRIH